MTHTGQMTGQVMNPTMDMMEITPKVIGTIGHILLPLRNGPNPRTSIQTSFLRTDRPTRSTGSVFQASACSDCSDTNL